MLLPTTAKYASTTFYSFTPFVRDTQDASNALLSQAGLGRIFLCVSSTGLKEEFI